MSSVSKLLLSSATVALITGAHVQGARPPGSELRGTPHVASSPAAALQQGTAASASLPTTAPERALIDKYCVTCHNQRLKTAGLLLDQLDITQVAANAAVLEKVVRKVGTGQMPPAGAARPDQAAADTFVASLVTALDRASAAAPNPGRPAAHRLNRTEYVNAIRDLLALAVDGRALLPADDSSYGFDNIADVLSMSPALLDRYMSAATKVSRLAIGDATIRPSFQTYRLSRFLRQDVRMDEKLPFGTRGGAAIDHSFPSDGEYVVKIRLQKPGLGQGGIRGMEKQHQIELRLDGTLLKQFSVGGEVTEGAYRTGIAFDPDDPVAARLHTYRHNADNHLEMRFATTAGRRTIGVAFLKEPKFPEGVLSERHVIIDRAGLDGEPGVDSIEIGGPYGAKMPDDTPSRRRIFVCDPATTQEEEPCAKRIISTLARRAYRRPVTDIDVQPLMTFYADARRDGDFDAGVASALEALLVSPKFLFRVEQDPAGAKPGTVYRVSDIDLASRLSFFLWSSIPDDELLQAAERGQLKDQKVLSQQVRRMLADDRSKALVDSFAAQWLLLRNMRLATPDPDLFPEFDDSLKEAFARETELFFESQVRENRSVLDLFTADYTFLNDRLAEHYGIPKVYGSHFRRVQLTDPVRFGLLGKGSVLTVTSYAHRTSVVKRGKWVLENVLGAPPPPPPANVPPLEENKQGAKPTSLKERMEQHRKNPGCAVCHARIDPLGFALENFDAIGQWRQTDNGIPVESTSVLADGTKLDGPVSFRDALLDRGDEIVTNVIEQLMTYAVGRGLEYYDAPAVRKIMREATPGGHRWADLVTGIVRSMPFQMRRVPGEGEAAAAAVSVAGQ
jgi:hypothetical protein